MLTAREHYIAHWLLWKATKNFKLGYAWCRISNSLKHKRCLTSKQYSRAMIINGEISSIMNKTYIFTKEHRDKISKANSGIKNGMYGKKHSKESLNIMSEKAKIRMNNPEAKAIIAESNKTRIISEETRKKMSEAQKNRAPMSEETRQKRSIAQKEAWKKRKNLMENLDRCQQLVLNE